MSRRVIWIGLLVAGLVLSGSANRLVDAVFHPWVLADPPLLDRWVGSFKTDSGNQLTVWLEIHRESAAASTALPCATCDQIEGTATTCDSHGELRRYRLTGSPLERHGHIVQLTAKPDAFATADGLELNALIGTWDGGDVIQMNVDYVMRRRSAKNGPSDIAGSQRSAVLMQRDRGAMRAENCQP